MNTNWKSATVERVENFKLFYSKKNKRPLLGFFYGSEYPVLRYNSGKDIPIKKYLTPGDFKIESYLEDFEYLFEKHENCGGDFIWSSSIYWGIPWLEAALGCPVLLNSYDSGSIHAERIPNFSGFQHVPNFSMDNKWVKFAIDFLEKTAEKSNGRYPLATTRMRGISDLLSLLYGTEDLIMKMMINPDEVMKTAEKLTKFWISFGKMQLERIPEFHGGVGSFYYNAWAPKDTIWHQEDAVALLSPDLYEAFIKPWDEQIVDAFGGCIMHQHSNGYFPYEYYIKMNFTALELHIDTGGPSAESLAPVYHKIMSSKPLIIWGEIPVKDMDWIFSNLPSEGLAVITVVNSEDEARQLWEKYIVN